jgi:serine/threonine protein kinase
MSSSIENKIYFSKYKTDLKIGQGSFGKIYSAHHINNGEKYALKLEKRNDSHSLLETETYILCYLKGEGIPYIKSFGFSGGYNVLVMELLGKSLETLFQENECKFSLKTVCMLAEQMITRLEYIHKKSILHRDIKPDNFTLGRGKQSHIVYLIDFGLAIKYKGNLEHKKYNENKKLIGTARYASINALKGCEQGRRDDLEALGYVLMYFLRGNLPWQGLKLNKGDDRYKKIYEKKKKTTPEELCVGYPKQFCEFIKYTKNLPFEQEPNYNYLKKLIYNVMDKYEYSFDYLYDWGIKKRKSGLSANININKGFISRDKSLDKKDKIVIEDNHINIAIKKIDSEKKRKSDVNNIKFSNYKIKKLNSDPRLGYKFNLKNSFKKKDIKKKKNENKNTKYKLINPIKNKIKSFRSSEKINKKKNNLKKSNFHDSHILDSLLNNESFFSSGAFKNESNHFKHFYSNQYKFLSELNSTSKKIREIEYKTKNIEIKKSKSNGNSNNDSQDKNCIIY